MTCAAQLGLLPEFDRTTDRRLDLDFWPTPPWLARAILRAPAAVPYNLGACSVLDAGAGLGVLADEAEVLTTERGLALPRITCVELHHDRCAALPERWERVEADFLEWGPAQLEAGRRWDVVLTNPPKKNGDRHVWIEWVTLCLALASRGGVVHALGHAGMLMTSERAAWWGAHKPQWYRPSPRRPSFSGDNGTDGRVWGWWQWAAAVPVETTRMELLEVEW